MNKLIIDKEIDIKDYTGQIDYTLSDNIINITGKCTLYDFDNNKNITINILDNGYLKYYKIRKESVNNKLLINQSNDTYLEYKEIIISNDDLKYDINTILHGNNNVSKVYLRCLNENKNVNIVANGKVVDNTMNNEFLEDLRGLNVSDNELLIKPDLQIESLDVIASHKVTISNVKQEELFYLESKGVSSSDALKLLKNGFILGILPDNMKEEIKDYIN